MLKEEVQLYSAGKTQRAPGEELQHIFPEGEKWCTGEETLQMVISSSTPDIYFKYINYITYLIHIYHAL